MEIKEKAEKAGKKICALSAPIFKCELNDAEAKEHIELLKKYIEIAKLLGTGIVRGFSFWARKPFAEAKEKILKWYEAADQVLEGTGYALPSSTTHRSTPALQRRWQHSLKAALLGTSTLCTIPETTSGLRSMKSLIPQPTSF